MRIAGTLTGGFIAAAFVAVLGAQTAPALDISFGEWEIMSTVVITMTGRFLGPSCK